MKPSDTAFDKSVDTPIASGEPLILARLAALVLLFALAWSTALAKLPEPTPETAVAELEAELATTAPVELDGARLFQVRGVSAFPAEQRALRIRGRIEALARDPGFRVETLRAVESDLATKLMAGDQLVMGVYDSDARLEGVSRQVLAQANLERIRLAVVDYREARSRGVLLGGAVRTLGATALLAAALALVTWTLRGLGSLLEGQIRSRIQSLESRSFQMVRAEQIWGTLRRGVRALGVLTVLVLLWLYLDFVLDQFVWTRPLGERLLDLLLGPLVAMGRGIVANIPNLLFLAVLFLVIRFILRLLRQFFEAVGRGSITLGGFAPDWAAPTYKMVRFAILAFGLIVAYPYIPGSESAAFKGVSLFIGVVFSLGSSSAIANLIAGYLMTYRRAFKMGDRVRIGDEVGDVSEIRVQATHLRTLKNEELVVPNSLLLSSQVINYSSLAAKHGLILHTTVSIGYENPWRQVEALLLLAAERTPGLLKEPGPFVLQRSLGDFAITYELNVYCGDAHTMPGLYSELHRHILDCFNEYSVPIMTPAYEGDPERPKLVPREQWYAAPAAPREQLPIQGEGV